MCSIESLANCRLVSRQWYKESLNAWGECCFLKFAVESDNLRLEYTGYDDSECVLSLENFLSFTKEQIPPLTERRFGSIVIECSRISPSVEDDLEAPRAGLCQHLKVLHLNDCVFSCNLEFLRLILLCPRLKELFITGCRFEDNDNGKRLDAEPNKSLKSLGFVWEDVTDRKLPICWTTLFQQFPLIETLSVGDGKMANGSDFDDITNAIREIRSKDPCALQLKNIDMDAIHIPGPFLSEDRISTIKELNLTMDRFVLDDDNEDLFRRVIEVCHKSIQQLRIDAALQTCRFPYGIRLEKLTILTIIGAFVDDLKFLNYTVNIEELNLNSISDVKCVKTSDNENEPALVMQKLKILKIHHLLTVEDIVKLKPLMPNVTDLSMELNDEKFIAVCRLWTNLEELCAYGSELTDDGILGEADGEGINLQQLKLFKFETDELTDRAVTEGLLRLPNLETLMREPEAEYTDWNDATRDAIEERNIYLIGEFFVNYDNKYSIG